MSEGIKTEDWVPWDPAWGTYWRDAQGSLWRVRYGSHNEVERVQDELSKARTPETHTPEFVSNTYGPMTQLNTSGKSGSMNEDIESGDWVTVAGHGPYEVSSEYVDRLSFVLVEGDRRWVVYRPWCEKVAAPLSQGYKEGRRDAARQVEQALLEHILFIGDGIPDTIGEDRPLFILSGTPAEFLRRCQDSDGRAEREQPQ